jgi:hypothetical protein
MLKGSATAGKATATRIRWLAGASVILPMAYRLVCGLTDLEPAKYRVEAQGWSWAANWWLNAAFYGVPYVVFGVMAVWSMGKLGAGISPKSRLVSLAGLGVNAGLWVQQGYTIWFVHGVPW